MELKEAVKKRKSIRGYKSDPVPQAVIREILETALRAPSAMNTQPWEVTVVTGDPLEQIRREYVKKLWEKEDFFSVKYHGVYRERQVELAKQLFNLMGIAREDKEKRNQWMERGFRFFDAPVAIIISKDSSLENSWAVFDIGCLTQNLCLLAVEYGLGTCIEDQGVAFKEVLREHLELPPSKDPVIGIALGYPDWDFPANELESPREEVDAVTTWVGF